jgi:signal transduction histidine kinase
MSTKMDDDARESMDTAYQSIDYMQSMLEDLLACARLESGKDMLQMEEVDVGEVLTEVLSQLRSEIERKRITVQRESVDGKGLRADRKSVMKIFMNLIGNAVNYIGEGSGRTIRIERSPEDVFTVEDNGIGIPEDARDEVMEKFRRGVNALNITGTGLGLPIVKTAVEAHGGKLWFDTEEGKGTAFHFTLQPRE